MKSYLQRLAAHAIPRAAGPLGNIHPIVGSIYSAAKHESAADFFPRETEHSIAAPKSAIGTETPIASNPVPSNPEQRETPHPENPMAQHLQAAQPTENAPFQPLLGKAETHSSPIRAHDRPQANPHRAPEFSSEIGPEEKIEFPVPRADSHKPRAGKDATGAPLVSS